MLAIAATASVFLRTESNHTKCTRGLLIASGNNGNHQPVHTSMTRTPACR
jgi:hypothetical protein